MRCIARSPTTASREHLIKEQSTTHDDELGLRGAFNKVVGATRSHHQQAYLHCEFEGGGIYKLLKAL